MCVSVFFFFIPKEEFLMRQQVFNFASSLPPKRFCRANRNWLGSNSSWILHTSFKLSGIIPFLCASIVYHVEYLEKMVIHQHPLLQSRIFTLGYVEKYRGLKCFMWSTFKSWKTKHTTLYQLKKTNRSSGSQENGYSSRRTPLA